MMSLAGERRIDGTDVFIKMAGVGVDERMAKIVGSVVGGLELAGYQFLFDETRGFRFRIKQNGGWFYSGYNNEMHDAICAAFERFLLGRTQ